MSWWHHQKSILRRSVLCSFHSIPLLVWVFSLLQVEMEPARVPLLKRQDHHISTWLDQQAIRHGCQDYQAGENPPACQHHVPFPLLPSLRDQHLNKSSNLTLVTKYYWRIFKVICQPQQLKKDILAKQNIFSNYNTKNTHANIFFLVKL